MFRVRHQSDSGRAPVVAFIRFAMIRIMLRRLAANHSS
jgi:hypothetical protein